MSVCEVLLGDLTFTVQHSLHLMARQRRREIGASRSRGQNHAHTFFWYCFSLSLCNFILGSAGQLRVNLETRTTGLLENSTITRCNLWDRLVTTHDEEPEDLTTRR